MVVAVKMNVDVVEVAVMVAVVAVAVMAVEVVEVVIDNDKHFSVTLMLLTLPVPLLPMNTMSYKKTTTGQLLKQ